MEHVHNVEHELNLNNKDFKGSEHVSNESKNAVQDFCGKYFAQRLERARFKDCISNFHTILKVLANGFSLPEAGREGIRKLVASYGSLQI